MCIRDSYIGEDTYSGTVISSFDVDKPDKTIDAKCIMNNSGEVYVSGNAMYLYHSDWSASRELTKISRISFEDGVMKTGAVSYTHLDVYKRQGIHFIIASIVIWLLL